MELLLLANVNAPDKVVTGVGVGVKVGEWFDVLAVKEVDRGDTLSGTGELES